MMASSHILFGRSALDGLPPAQSGARDYYYDTRQPGLRLDVTPQGRKTFQVYVKSHGRPRTFTLGRFNPGLADSIELPKDCSHLEYLTQSPELNVRCARDLASRILIDIKSGIDPTALKQTKRMEMTLGELFEEYVTRHLIPNGKKPGETRERFELYMGTMPKSPSTSTKRKPRAKLPGSVNWQNRTLSSITKNEVQRLIAGLATKGGSINNANRALTILRAMYNRAIEWGVYKGPNPTDKLPKYKAKSRERFLHADELPRFFASLEMEKSIDCRDFYLLSLLTGQRKSNVREMSWADINLDRAVWTIPGHSTKNKDSITVALVPEAVAVLRSRKPEEAAEFVFPGVGKSGHIENPRHAWGRLLDRDEVMQLAARINEAGGTFHLNFDDPEKPHYDDLTTALQKARAMAAKLKIDTTGARLENLRPHDLRRTLGSWQAAAGASLTIIGKSLGHRSVGATLIYSRLNLDPVRASVNAATRAMLVAGGVVQEAEVTSISAPKKARRKVNQ
jgi:integrase